MEIKAQGQITLSSVVDVQATYRYYLLQSSTLVVPSKPTTFPPSSVWNDTEPTYANGSTNSLYTVDCTVFSDGSFSYSEVSMSTAYEAAKTAYNKAKNAQTAVDNLDTSLDQEEIFRRLTNNGTEQGIYIKNGKLYINATYVDTGTFLADLIKAGVIKSKDGKSVVIDLDNGNVDLTGTITTKVTADEDYYNISRQSTFKPNIISITEDRVNDDGTKERGRTWILPEQILIQTSTFDSSGNNTGIDGISISAYGRNVISGLSAPVNDSDATSKAYVDEKISDCFSAKDYTGHLTSDSNFNTLANGRYWANLWQGSNTGTGLPPTSMGDVFVFGYPGVLTHQVFFEEYGSVCRRTHRVGANVWSNWTSL